jgi:hypothetical protein
MSLNNSYHQKVFLVVYIQGNAVLGTYGVIIVWSIILGAIVWSVSVGQFSGFFSSN